MDLQELRIRDQFVSCPTAGGRVGAYERVGVVYIIHIWKHQLQFLRSNIPSSALNFLTCSSHLCKIVVEISLRAVLSPAKCPLPFSQDPLPLCDSSDRNQHYCPLITFSNFYNIVNSVLITSGWIAIERNLTQVKHFRKLNLSVCFVYISLILFIFYSIVSLTMSFPLNDTLNFGLFITQRVMSVQVVCTILGYFNDEFFSPVLIHFH